MDFDIFAIDDSQVELPSKKKNFGTVYSPKPKDGQDGTYNARLRLLSNPKNVKSGNIIEKTAYYINCPEADLNQYVDGQEKFTKGKCPLNKSWWDLWNRAEKQGDQAAKDMIKGDDATFTRSSQYFCYALVVSDPQNKELENTIVVFRFPNAIRQLIIAQQQPEKVAGVDDDDSVESCNVFNPLTGKDFVLKLTQKGKFPDYQNCKFADKSTIMKFKGIVLDPKKMKDDAVSGAMKEFRELIDGRPDIYEQESLEWSDEIVEKVESFIETLGDGLGDSDFKPKKKPTKKDVKSDDDDDDDIFDEEEDDKPVKKKEPVKTPKKAAVKAEDDDDDMFDDDEDEVPAKAPKKEPKKEAKPKKAAVKADDDDDDDIDDWLNDVE
jgi:hypothetical protein